MFDSLLIDGRSKHSAADQIFHYIIDEILMLNIHAQTVFPLSSNVALLFDIQPSVVQAAYSRLVLESYCEVLGNTITLISEELRRSIPIHSMEDVLNMATALNMKVSIQEFEPLIATIPTELLSLSKRSMPKESLLIRSLNTGDNIPLSYVILVVNTEKLTKGQMAMATNVTFYAELSNHPDAVVHPTLISACRLSEDISKIMRLPHHIPALCMHSSIDFLTHQDVAQMYVVLTPRAFFTLNT